MSDLTPAEAIDGLILPWIDDLVSTVEPHVGVELCKEDWSLIEARLKKAGWVLARDNAAVAA